MINIYNISGTLISGGLEPEKTSANLKRDLTPSLGWTKSDMRHHGNNHTHTSVNESAKLSLQNYAFPYSHTAI